MEASVGCSTGEEAYSLAMVFKEAMERAKPKGRFTLQIFATDLDRDAIDKARQGFFPDNISADVSPERLGRFFSKEDGGYRVHKDIREMVIFAPQNLIMDPPFTKLDLLCCRNLLIYLAGEMQKKLFPLFHYSLNPGGILFLGSAETIGSFTDLFAPLVGKSRIFQRSKSTLHQTPVEFPSSFTPGAHTATNVGQVTRPPLSLQSLADQLILHRFAPPAVLVNDKGDILYVSGRTGKYLEPAAGKANWNIFAMAREGIRYELASAFQEAILQKEAVTLRGLKVGTNGGQQCLDLTIQTLEEPEALRGLIMIVFTDVAAPAETKEPDRSRKTPARRTTRTAELEMELQQVREMLQTTRKEMQISHEELKSTNEELQSTNEELQSTNEELTTSKEEMQSLNEELQTVNTELQTKVDDLSVTNSDMKNLLDSTDIATMFLDNDLHIRRFTAQATKIIKLIAADVGRPMTDLASDLDYPDLAADAVEVLRTLASTEKSIATHDGRWFTVRIMPYRTLDNRIDGVVITFADITLAKSLEAELRDKKDGLEKRVAEQSERLDKTKKRVKKMPKSDKA